MSINTHSLDVLENERVRLEPLDWKHLPALLPIALKYPDLLKYSPVHFGSEMALKTYFEKTFSAKEKGTKLPFAIFDKQKNSYAGTVSYTHLTLPTTPYV